MGQLDELKVFVSERLHAATSEILGAIEKTITDYEEQTSRLKEENDRNRSLLDIILKAKLPQKQAGHETKSTPHASGPQTSNSNLTRKSRETGCHPTVDALQCTPSLKKQKGAPAWKLSIIVLWMESATKDLQCAFTSRTDFLKYAFNDTCPYCLKITSATETHLIKKHYFFAVHFVENGTEKFVVPCTCKDRIQGRSHWHCPSCPKIIYRKCNFERHLSKQHCYMILQQSQDTETSQPSVSTFEEGAPLSPENWAQQELGGLDQEAQQAALLLQTKDKQAKEIWTQSLVEQPVSHAELKDSGQLQIKLERIQNGNSQAEEQTVETDHAQYSGFNMNCAGSYIHDPSEISCMESGKGHPLSNSSAQPLETHPDSEIQQPAGKYQHTTEAEVDEWKKKHAPSSLKALKSKREKLVKRSLPPLHLNVKKSTQSSVSENPTGPHSCKVCGKTFHYMYTLREHAQTHGADKIHICGICGKHLESNESLFQHLQSHAKKNKCGICGKQFSNHFRLERHRRFHRPKGLNQRLLEINSITAP